MELCGVLRLVKEPMIFTTSTVHGYARCSSVRTEYILYILYYDWWWCCFSPKGIIFIWFYSLKRMLLKSIFVRSVEKKTTRMAFGYINLENCHSFFNIIIIIIIIKKRCQHRTLYRLCWTSNYFYAFDWLALKTKAKF